MPATIQIQIDSGDNPASVTLLSLVRTDTGAAVPFAPPDFTDAGGGKWTYTFTPPVEGIFYTYAVRFTYAGGATTDPPPGSFFVPSSLGYVGRYTTEASLGRFLAEENLTNYLDLNGDRLRDPNAAEQAIRHAEGRIDFHAGGGAGLIPLTFEATAAGVVGADIVEWWANGLAAYQAAKKRGLAGTQLDPFKEVRDEILAEIKAYREGTLALPGVIEPAVSTTVSVPSVARADGTAVTAADLAGQALRERLVNADGGWYWPN